MSEQPFVNDPEVNIVALDLAIRSQAGHNPDAVVDAAIKFRHFLSTGKVLIPEQPEQPA